VNHELNGNIDALEMQRYRRSMKIPDTEHVTKD